MYLVYFQVNPKEILGNGKECPLNAQLKNPNHCVS